MSTIVTRAGKGSPLTHTEVDNNFTNLNTDKAEDSTVVKLTGNQTIGGTKTFSNTITGSISGNAGTVTNGVVTTGSYADPSWITSLDDGKVLPSMSGNSGKYLTTDGTNSSWGAVAVTPTSVSDQANTSTGYFDVPSGTTAQRPASPNNGMVRYNTSTLKFEFYQNGDWVNYSLAYTLEYLVVAGGGGGAGGWGGLGGGGGGAGGYIASSVSVLQGINSYSITIGSGGAGAQSQNATLGGNGTNSSFGSLTTCIGGGGAATWSLSQSSSGGSGAGASYSTGSPGSGTSGQGFGGGLGSAGTGAGGGGGGGALNQGGNGSSTAGGAGGNGAQWLNGTYYAGGGGGGVISNQTIGAGGLGGGGNGGRAPDAGVTPVSGSPGSANTGGGGGGAANNSASHFGGNGGSGVVIVRYLGSQKGTGGTVTSAGGYTYHTFTTSGTFTA